MLSLLFARQADHDDARVDRVMKTYIQESGQNNKDNAGGGTKEDDGTHKQGSVASDGWEFYRATTTHKQASVASSYIRGKNNRKKNPNRSCFFLDTVCGYISKQRVAIEKIVWDVLHKVLDLVLGFQNMYLDI